MAAEPGQRAFREMPLQPFRLRADPLSCRCPIGEQNRQKRRRENRIGKPPAVVLRFSSRILRPSGSGLQGFCFSPPRSQPVWDPTVPRNFVAPLAHGSTRITDSRPATIHRPTSDPISGDATRPRFTGLFANTQSLQHYSSLKIDCDVLLPAKLDNSACL